MSRAEQPRDLADLPERTVRNRSGYATKLHRRHPKSDEPVPACGERERDAAFKEVSTAHLYPAFYGLCTHPECFGDDDHHRTPGGHPAVTPGRGP